MFCTKASLASSALVWPLTHWYRADQEPLSPDNLPKLHLVELLEQIHW